MPKKRNLNGLPNSLVQRYFSTLFWWDKAYMADWIWNAAREKDILEIEIDILNVSVIPREVHIKPIVGHLARLQDTIAATLKANNFPVDFIVEAKFKISLQLHKPHRLLYCQGVLTDKEGKVYNGKVYTEVAYEKPFKVFPAPMIKIPQNPLPSIAKSLNNIATWLFKR